MERRASDRVCRTLNAMLMSQSLNYKGILRNCSAEGICITIKPEPHVCQQLEGMTFEVRIDLPGERHIYLQCEVVRSNRHCGVTEEHTIGMKMINRHKDYTDFLNMAD